MNVVFIIPTGIGCSIGGHAGDANPSAKLIASLCDNFISHPNVFNACDINEMSENSLYVEGSILDRFLRGEIYLEKVYQNKILLVVNSPVTANTINSASAARATIGADIEILELKTPLKMISDLSGKCATGQIEGWEELIDQVSLYDFDVLAVQTYIELSDKIALNYFNNGGINPWGGVEAKLSKLLSEKLDLPVVHAPVGDAIDNYGKVVDPKISAELISVSHVHCLYKGLNKAPRINYNSGISNKEVDFLITPHGVFGEPHRACVENNIPIISVKDNTTVLNDEMPDNVIVLNNYLEVAGYLSSRKAGITLESLQRPIPSTIIH